MEISTFYPKSTREDTIPSRQSAEEKSGAHEEPRVVLKRPPGHQPGSSEVTSARDSKSQEMRFEVLGDDLCAVHARGTRSPVRGSAAALAPTDAERSALSVRRDSPDRLADGLLRIDVQAGVGRAVSDAASLDEVEAGRAMDAACDVLTLDERQVGELESSALLHRPGS